MGVSFTVEGHFHVLLSYHATQSTSSDDGNQADLRVRTLFIWMGYRVHNQGAPRADYSAENSTATVKALDHHVRERAIARTKPGAAYANDPALAFLRTLVMRATHEDQTHYLKRYRTLLRKRDMTISLVGLRSDAELRIGQRWTLPPLPPHTSRAGPNVRAERVAKLKSASDLSQAQVSALWEAAKRRQLTTTEQAQLDRFNIRKDFVPNGPLSMDELIERQVLKKFGDKVNHLSLVMGSVERAAGPDAHQLHHEPTWERQHYLLQRDLVRRLLSTLPLFDLEWCKQPERLASYRLYRNQLENGSVLHSVEDIMASPEYQRLAGLPARSGAKDIVKRTVLQFNAIFRWLALPLLEPCGLGTGAAKKLKGKAVQWKFNVANLRESLFYASLLDTPAPPMVVNQVVIENPLCFTDSIQDPASGIVYALLPVAPTLVPHEVICVPILPAQAQEHPKSFQHTLWHTVSTLGNGNPLADQISVSWEWFHAHALRRVQYPAPLRDLILYALDQMGYPRTTVSPRSTNWIPLPHRPTHCLVPRLGLARIPNSPYWMIQSDESVYFASGLRDAMQ